MRVSIRETGAFAPISATYVTVTRDPFDPRPSNESHLLHMIKKELIAQGFDVIKKRMWKDGHMVSDHCQYIRSRNVKAPDAFMLWDDQYAIRDLAEDFRKNGVVTLHLVPCKKDEAQHGN
jgi:hypothetical protein